MKVIALSNKDDLKRRLQESRDQGYITFVYHHADPTHALMLDKFLYIKNDSELQEKVNLLQADITVSDRLRS